MSDLDEFQAWLDKRIERMSNPETFGRAPAAAAYNLVDDFRREQASNVVDPDELRAERFHAGSTEADYDFGPEPSRTGGDL